MAEEKNIFKTRRECSILAKCAFTLAEVLIVLGIMGIIAENTLPALVNDYQKQETLSGLRNVYTELNAAINSARIAHGTDVNSWYLPTDTTLSAATYYATTYLIPYMKVASVCGASTTTDCTLSDGYFSNLTSSTKLYQKISGNSGMYSFMLKNGAVIGITTSNLNGPSIAAARVYIYFDINGMRKPNLIGKDCFMIELGGNYGLGDKNKLLPYSAFYTRDVLLHNGDTNGCDKTTGSGLYCFAVIMLDSWQIKSDYPW